MRRAILFALFSLGCCWSLQLEAQSPPPPETALKAMEEQLQIIANSDIPDFAPATYQSYQARLRELRRVFEKEGRLPDRALRDAREELENFKGKTGRIKQVLGKAYRLRNAALQLNFVRTFNAAILYRAEQSYAEALSLVGEEKFDKARMRANAASEQYQSLIRQAQSQMQRMMAGTLNSYRAAISADLRALSTSSSDFTDLAGAEGVYLRVNRNFGVSGTDVDRLIGPTWHPPPPVGPIPPVIAIGDRAASSISLSLTDLSDNETGNRVLRTTDLFNWQVMADIGSIPKFETVHYTDANLRPDTRYCYTIESHNTEGARQSPFRCTYTLDGHNIGVWRLQLRVKVANLADAGTDHPLRIQMANNGEHLPVETFLDYGQDDFERNSDFTYDLNIEHIRELSDITDFTVVNHGNEQDTVLIEAIDLLVNEHEVFSRHFGITPVSALRLGLSGSYQVEHADLRSNPSWQTFVSNSLNDRAFNLPPIRFADDGQIQIQIPHDQIVSRIESFVGHLINTSSDISGSFKWGHLDGPAVEVQRISTRAIRVDLDTEATINNWPNPALDIDFDIEVAKRCEDGENKLIIDLTSKNFSSNADFALWKDLASLGVLKLTGDLLDWYALNCATPPEIKQSYDVSLPQNINCDDLNITVGAGEDLIICCFAP